MVVKDYHHIYDISILTSQKTGLVKNIDNIIDKIVRFIESRVEALCITKQNAKK